MKKHKVVKSNRTCHIALWEWIAKETAKGNFVITPDWPGWEENGGKYFNRMCRLIRVGFKPGSDMYGGYWKYGRRKIYDRWVHECPNKDFNDELFAFGYYQDIVIHYDWEDKE